MKLLENIHEKKPIAIAIVVPIVIIAAVCINTYRIYRYGADRVYLDFEDVENHEIGILFGAGVKSNREPGQPLVDRLEVTAELYEQGKIEKILITGDNSDSHYNETDVMKEYLVEKHEVPESDIILDEHGNRTYDSCIRARDLFEVEEALLITQGFHLPRSIYTCEKLGIESVGISATMHDYEEMTYFKAREFLAISRAWYDLNIYKPEYVRER